MESACPQTAHLANIGVSHLVKSSTAHHHHISSKIDVYLEITTNAISVLFGMAENAYSIQTLAQLAQPGMDKLVSEVDNAELDIILDPMASAYPSHNNVSHLLYGTVKNVLYLTATAHLELMLKETNVCHMRHAKMDSFGIQTI